jgi:hypothetical protein
MVSSIHLLKRLKKGFEDIINMGWRATNLKRGVEELYT